MDRRDFVKAASVLAAGSCVRKGFGGSTPKRTSVPITHISLDLNNIHKWDVSNGDTWDPFWADDDNLYAFNCDGRGFGTLPRNLAFNKLEGNQLPLLHGSMVNSMDEYGASSKKGADGATWKACGQECIDGIFYTFVSRNTYGSDSGDPYLRQTAHNSSLIKSTDRGATWTRSAAENYARPMWKGAPFGAPFFIHYGQNGGRVVRDGADRYVYASSTNGFWNDGDQYILGRVPREKLSSLQASDWSYSLGGDGTDASRWSFDIAEAVPFLSLPRQCGQGPICYVPALDAYLMIAWYNTATMKKWFEPNEMRYDFYQAEHPWGPWRQVASYSDSFIVGGHMYGPSLCARFQKKEGSQLRMTLFTAGCPFEDVPSGLYKMWEIPIIAETVPLPPYRTVRADDRALLYRGNWRSGDDGMKNIRPYARYTTRAGDFCELTFRGTGIACIAEKDTGFGEFDVYLDGQKRQQVKLSSENFPRISSVEVFAARKLDAGEHTLRLVSASSRYVVLDALRVEESSAIG